MNLARSKRILPIYLPCLLHDSFVHFHNTLSNLLIYSNKLFFIVKPPFNDLLFLHTNQLVLSHRILLPRQARIGRILSIVYYFKILQKKMFVLSLCHRYNPFTCLWYYRNIKSRRRQQACKGCTIRFKRKALSVRFSCRPGN